MREIPAPPENMKLDDQEREQWQRIHAACSWIKPQDGMMLAVLIHTASDVRRLADAGLEVEDPEMADTLVALHRLLADFFIEPPLARQLGLLPLGVATAEELRARRVRRSELPERPTPAEWNREKAVSERRSAARWSQLASRQGVSAESAQKLQELADESERIADELEMDLDSP